jgi:galactonate dehydratase
VGGGLPVVQGYILPPTAPGLGVSVDEQEAARHPFAQEVLMQWWHQDGAVADW